jgi:Ca2+-binding EF-hand superfamily protein
MCQRNNEPLHGHSPCNYCIAHTPTNCKESSCKLISKSRSRSNHKSKLSALPVAAAFLLYMSAYANASHTSTTTTHRHYRLRQSAFISSPSHHDRLCAPHKEIAPSCDFTGTSPFYATIVKTETDPNPNRSTDKKILLEEKKLKLQSSIHYQPIPYRGVSSTHSHSIKKNGNVSILKAGTSISHAPPIKDGVMNFTIERKLTTAINHALTKKNGNRGIQINGAPSSSLAHQDTLIEISASPSTSTSTSTSTPPSKKLTISNLWKRRHAQSIDEGIRRERVLSEILDETSNGDKGKTKKKRKSYAAKTIAGLISALAEEATGLEVEVDARNDTPFWKKQIDAVEINFSRLGVRALRMGGLDEALLDMSEDLSPYEKETMADSLSEEAKNTYDEIDLMETPVSVSPVDEVFDRIDTDNSGTLDEEELTRALSISSGLSNYSEKKNASSALSKLVSRLVNLYDTNGDGVVDREEYRKLVDDMTEVRNTQRMKQKEREDKKQERLERKGVVHPLKWMKLATRTFQRWSRKEKQEEYGDIDETVNSNVEQTEISTERDSEIKTVNPFSLAGTRVMATAAQVTGVNFEGAQDISDDPSVMNTMSRVEGSILFKDLKLDLRRLLFGAVPFVKRVSLIFCV